MPKDALNLQEYDPKKDNTYNRQKEALVGLDKEGDEYSIAEVIDFVIESHGDQRRKSGEPFYYHPIYVAHLLYNWGIRDKKIIVAALLHDVPEDVEHITIDHIRNKYNQEIATLVDGVTKIKGGSDDETILKVLKASDINPAIALIKAADRLHNLWTLDGIKDPKKRQKKAQETLDIYAPLIEANGAWKIKESLEDEAFKFTNPERYAQIKNLIKNDPRLSTKSLAQVIEIIQNADPLNCRDCIWQGGDDNCLYIRDQDGQEILRIEIKQSGIYRLAQKLSERGLKDDQIQEIDDVVSYRITAYDNRAYRLWSTLEENILIDHERSDNFIGNKEGLNGYKAKHLTMNFDNFGAVKFAFITPEQEEFNQWGIISILRKPKPSLEELERYKLKPVLVNKKLHFVPKDAKVLDLICQINPNILHSLAWIESNKKPIGLIENVNPGAKIQFYNDVYDESSFLITNNILDQALPRTRRVLEKLKQQQDKLAKVNESSEKIRDKISHLGIVDLRDIDTYLKLAAFFVLQNKNASLDDLIIACGQDQSTLDKLLDWMTFNGITRSGLDCSTIRVVGIDKPGVIRTITNLLPQGISIKKIIVNWKNSTDLNQDKKTYEVRVLVNWLDKNQPDNSQSENLKQYLVNTNNFDVIDIV